MKINLSGQKVLVTGASRGIGRAIAEQLAASGAKVAIHYHRNAKAAQKVADRCGPEATLFQADLNDTRETLQLFEQVVAHFGRLTALVNNAGISIGTAVEGDDAIFSDSWSRTMLVNLHATGLLCKKAINHFCDGGGGRIVNIASRAAFRGDTSDYLAYAASKGGVVSLTRSIARAYGKQHVKAFVVAPGLCPHRYGRRLYPKVRRRFCIERFGASYTHPARRYCAHRGVSDQRLGRPQHRLHHRH